MYNKLFSLALASVVLFGSACSLTAANNSKSEMLVTKSEVIGISHQAALLQKQAHDALDTFAKEHLERANLTLRPNRSTKEVKRRDKGYVAFYSELDVYSLQTKIYESDAPSCEYVGHIIYVEKQFESVGASKKEALAGNFKEVKLRRIRELTRYHDGTWHY